MGSCDSKDVVVSQNARPSRSNTISKKDNEKEKEETNDAKFKDMPEWDGERYRGEGVKRMKGYKCNLKIDDLSNLREEFWQSKIQTKIIWKHIRAACLMDDGNYHLL
jgi:hypothetical protein